MNILVTGHRGFIAGHMVRALAGHNVTTFEWGDEYYDLHDVDWVIHMGAISSTVERDVDKVMTQNYDFSCRLLDDCVSRCINFQYSSSASVYGTISSFTESDPLSPSNPYAWSKYMFERHATKLQLSTKHSVIQGFRYFNVYGPDGEEHKGTQASPYMKFKKQAEENREIRVFENSDRYLRDFIHVSEIVDTHKKFFGVKESGIWNVGTGKTKSFVEVAKTFKVKITEIPMPEVLHNSYQKYTCADTTKLNATLAKYGV
jgi:ADP-L-glycero-D-manno-heptose 6-epimerase